MDYLISITVSALIVAVIAILSHYLYRSKHPQIDYESDHDLSANIDFSEYLKKYAQDLKIQKKNLLNYLLSNKKILQKRYEQKTKRKLNKTDDYSQLFIKVFNEY